MNRFLAAFDGVYYERENPAKTKPYVRKLAAAAKGPHSARGTFKLNFLLGLSYYYLLQDKASARTVFYQALASEYSGPGLDKFEAGDNYKYYFMIGNKIYYHAAKMERLLGNYPAAEALIATGLAKDPGEYDFYMERMEINFAQKNYRETIRDSKLILQTSLDYHNRLHGYAEEKMHYIRAKAHEALGELNAAESCYDKLLSVFWSGTKNDQYTMCRDILRRKIERANSSSKRSPANRGKSSGSYPGR